MVTPDKKPSTVHLFAIPADISKFTDAQVEAWAEKVSEQWAEIISEEIVPILKSEEVIEENGDNT